LHIFADARRVVIKVGTSTLTHATGHINIRKTRRLVSVFADLANAGRQVVLVTSGALSVGVGKLGLPERPGDTPTRQAAAAVGQCQLMYLYDNLFSGHNRTIAQVLLTKDIVDQPPRRQNVANTLEQLLSMNVIPIVNENDTVSTDELEGENIGDNDTLSAIVATLVGADVLVLVSDIAGLYTANPREDPGAVLIPEVREITPEVMAAASGTGSKRGTGGMLTKMCAARIATAAGIDMAIVSGDNPDNLYDLFDGKPCGTHFVAARQG